MNIRISSVEAHSTVVCRGDLVREMIRIEPKAEVELLLNQLYPFAEKMLKLYGEFSPFGGYIDTTGHLVHAGIDDIEADESGAEMLSRLVDGLTRIVVENGARACGFAVNVTLPYDNGVDVEDAVRIFLEHKDGYCVDVFYCYKLSGANELCISKNYTQQGKPVFFVKQNL